jgi:hypothetical protein
LSGGPVNQFSLDAIENSRLDYCNNLYSSLELCIAEGEPDPSCPTEQAAYNDCRNCTFVIRCLIINSAKLLTLDGSLAAYEYCLDNNPFTSWVTSVNCANLRLDTNEQPCPATNATSAATTEAPSLTSVASSAASSSAESGSSTLGSSVSSSSASSAPTSSSSQAVSQDGFCGDVTDETCLGSAFGDCCGPLNYW